MISDHPTASSSRPLLPALGGLAALALAWILFPAASPAETKSKWERIPCSRLSMKIDMMRDRGFNCHRGENVPPTHVVAYAMDQIQGDSFIRIMRKEARDAPFFKDADRNSTIRAFEKMDKWIKDHRRVWSEAIPFADGTLMRVSAQQPGHAVWSCFFHASHSEPQDQGYRFHNLIEYCEKREDPISEATAVEVHDAITWAR